MIRVVSSLLVFSLGVVVLVGWVADIASLKSIHPSLVTMKAFTAIGFVCCGLIGLMQYRKWYPLTDLVAFLYLGLLSVVWVAPMMLPGASADSDVMTHAPGYPSHGTMVAFAMCCLGAISEQYSRRAGIMLYGAVAGLGAVAMAGYMLNIPAMYYYFPGRTTAMAVHTALGFVVGGGGMCWAAWRIRDAHQ